MRLFVQVNIGHWQEELYEKPLLSFASSLSDDVLGTDVDNQSDPYIINLVKQLLDQSQRSFLFIQIANENQPLDSLLSLINHLFNLEEKIHLIVLSGKHTALERMLSSFDKKLVKNSDEDMTRKMIRQFVIN
jgi:hypothetical protein